MVYRSERVVQRNLGLQYVFGTTFLITLPVHNTSIHMVYCTVFLSHRFCHGSGTKWNRCLHYYQYYRSYKHCWNGTYLLYVHRYKYNICTLYIMQEKRHIQTESNEISYLFISNNFFSLFLVVWTSLINVINHYTYWFIWSESVLIICARE